MKFILCDNEVARSQMTEAFDKLKIPVYLEWQPYLDPTSEDYMLDGEHVVLIIGQSIYNQLHQLDVNRVIHLGLRSYNWGTVKAISVLTYKKCRMIFCDPSNLNTPFNMEKYKTFIKFDVNKPCEFVLNDDQREIVTLDDADKVLNKFNTKIDMGFDFESFGFPEQWNFEPVGIGISTRNYGAYIDFRKYSSEASRERGLNLFKDWVSEYYRYLWAYYISFEVNALRKMFHKFFPINDVMALLKCDEYNGGLKVTAQHYLNVGAWDTEQDDLMDQVNRLFNSTKDFKDAIRLRDLSDESSPEYPGSLEIKKIFEDLKKYNFEMDMLEKYWFGPFAVTPAEVTGKYCIYDAFYTLCLKDVIDGRYHYIGDRDMY